MENLIHYSWLTIVIKPRKTMRDLISSGSNKRAFFILVLLSVIVQGLKNKTPIVLPPIELIILSVVLLVGALLLGVLVGMLIIHICAELLKWTGNWLGGQGDYEEIKLALAWSNVPIIWFGMIWLIIFYVINLYLNPIYLTGLSWLDYLLGIWAFVIYLYCLGEAQKFSVWKALLNSILAVLVVCIPIAVLVGAGYLGYHYGLGK